MRSCSTSLPIPKPGSKPLEDFTDTTWLNPDTNKRYSSRFIAEETYPESCGTSPPITPGPGTLGCLIPCSDSVHGVLGQGPTQCLAQASCTGWAGRSVDPSCRASDCLGPSATKVQHWHLESDTPLPGLSHRTSCLQPRCFPSSNHSQCSSPFGRPGRYG